MAGLLPIKFIIFMACMAVLVAACVDSPTTTPAPNATFTLAPPTETPVPTSIPPTSTPELELVDPSSFLTHTPNEDTFLPLGASQSVQAAVDHLRSTTDMDAIQLFSLKSVEWQSRGLECSDDEVSTVPLTSRGRVPGYQIVLGDDENIYIYHSDNEGVVILCPDAALFTDEGSPVFFDPATEALSIAARQELSETLETDLESIEVMDVTVMIWTDTSLGCPLPDVVYREAEIIGYRLVLQNDDEDYLYHADGLQVQFCPTEREVLPPPFGEPELESLPTSSPSVTP